MKTIGNIELVCLDMDGVLVDLHKGAAEHFDRPESRLWNFWESWGMSDDEFWSGCRGRGWWANLPAYGYARRLFTAIDDNFETIILTKPKNSDRQDCIAGKIDWAVENLGARKEQVVPMDDKFLLANPRRILVDDYEPNITPWERWKGLGYGWKQPWNNFHGTEENLLAILGI